MKLKKEKILNTEQGILNIEVKARASSFFIPCSIFSYSKDVEL